MKGGRGEGRGRGGGEVRCTGPGPCSLVSKALWLQGALCGSEASPEISPPGSEASDWRDPTRGGGTGVPDRPHQSMRNISQFASGFAIGSSFAICHFIWPRFVIFYGGPPLALGGLSQTFTSSQLLASTVGGASSWRRRVSPHPISPLALGIGSSSSRGKAASHP